MPAVVILPRANAQIIDVLDFTREEFGEAKYLEYRELIGLALATLAATPTAGKHRPEIHPDAWTYHIARPGRKARHLFLYRIRDAPRTNPRDAGAVVAIGDAANRGPRAMVRCVACDESRRATSRL